MQEIFTVILIALMICTIIESVLEAKNGKRSE